MSEKKLNAEELGKVSGGKPIIDEVSKITCPYCGKTFNVTDVDNNGGFCPNPDCGSDLRPGD